MRHFILTLLKPINKFLGNLYMPNSFKACRPVIKEYYKFLSLINQWDVIVTITKGYGANPLIPAKWKHILIYIGEEDGVPTVFEALSSGTTKRPLLNCMAEKDSIAVIRSSNHITYGNIIQALKFIDWSLGRQYDYYFDDFSKTKYEAFYCSELVWEIWKILYPNTKLPLYDAYGKMTITPDSFYDSEDTEIIYEFRG